MTNTSSCSRTLLVITCFALDNYKKPFLCFDIAIVIHIVVLPSCIAYSSPPVARDRSLDIGKRLVTPLFRHKASQ